MYNSVLVLHSWLRWVVLIAGLLVVVRAAMGMNGQTRWGAGDERNVKIFLGSLDLQFLLGLLLYGVLSPIVRLAMSDVAGAMRNGDSRFWLVEHLAGMLVAVVFAHVGRGKLKKAADDGSKQRMAALFFGIAMVVMLLSIPWPGMPAARPLFRF